MSQRPRDQVRYSYGYGSTPSFRPADDEQLYSPQLDRLQHADSANDGFSTYDDFKPPNRQSTQSVPTMATRPSSRRMSSTLLGELDDSTPLSTLMGQVEAKEAQEAQEKEFDPEAPTISKTDWLPGESRKDRYHKRAERKARAATAVGRARNRWSDLWANHWKKLLIGFFAIGACLAILLAFTIPRVPTYSFSSDASLTSNDDNPYVSSADPTEFYWNGNFSLAINAHSSFVPLKYTSFHVSVRDYQTGVEIGTGNKTMTVDGRKTTDVTVPVYFYGTFDDDTDQTYLDMRESCVHLWTGTTRPTMNLTMTVTSKILGRIGTQTSKRLVATNLTCPIQFASNAS